MPKVNIDYSNTIIYKISCNDLLITNIYVGHTTNFVQRKYAHKQTCNNINSPYYNLKLYKTIRENGNWSNWTMSIINFYNCKNHLEARQKEHEYFIKLKASLNSVEPLSQKYFVSASNAHISDTLITNDSAILPSNNFTCIICNYNTSRKNDYTKHILTPKHQMANKLFKISQNHKCSHCEKSYKHKSSLCKHVKQCLNQKLYSQNQQQQQQPIIDTNLIIELLKQNQELQKSLIELSKEKGIINNCVTNNNNKTFNIQVYLNEDCKDALNISEFVNSIKLQLHDLEETGRLGYVEGVSKIITTKLNDLDVTKRPIQCSDVKRETLYIKDEDKWVKEGNEKDKIKLAIKQIANKNIQQIPIWVKANPDCMDSDSRKNDAYLQIVSNAMSGSSKEEQCNNLNKIVTNISKEVTIEKLNV
jgi:hypothetical protein